MADANATGRPGREQERYCMVLTTCGSRGEAEKLASALVEQRLAACVQVSDVTSYYAWEGRVDNDPELLLLIKTKASVYPALEAFIRERHSYDLPEIVRLPIEGGLAGYLAWLDESTG